MRYQNIIHIIIWMIFLFVYSQAGAEITYAVWFVAHDFIVREPLKPLNPLKAEINGWEVAMYVMALAFALEGQSTI